MAGARLVPMLGAILAASLALPALAQSPAGAVQGRVDILHPLRTVDMPSGPNGTVRMVPVVRRQAVVFLEGVPGPPAGPPPMRARLGQVDETFVPHLVAVTVGSSVEFPNDDRVYHNVFSLSKTKRFDLGRYAAGQSKSVTFDRPGYIRVFCDIHSHMNAFILVFDHRYFAVTDEEGRFRIEQVPPGTYRATVWYEGSAAASQTVTVSAGGAAALDFRIR